MNYSEEEIARAREIAIASGHDDPDRLVICTDDSLQPVWLFYAAYIAE